MAIKDKDAKKKNNKKIDKENKDNQNNTEIQSSVKDEEGFHKLMDSAPAENEAFSHPNSKDILIREPLSFRVNRKLWLDFDYYCKSQKKRTSRSDVLEAIILKLLGKTKDDYR